ncbi:MAG: sulfur oxidation c-type cytochrome SoxX [Sedimenticola selenatireducens]|uniref:Sulfur oxidation c-type cytochrome SoxX n=2 Tax=Sedimenticola selenatireducens TaxID=191960 RepID=A0A557SBZ5_9GAMM|nr:sulfur oxidation c-type cytochrome SoxX [Sedimenticola selenatireducens]TVT62462.1 MAG: sulfur oxidation c-type cytochrome SoxX [Sedimenticola selenatireducens]
MVRLVSTLVVITSAAWLTACSNKPVTKQEPAAMAAPSDPKIVAAGKAIATGRSQGNCLACHMIEDGESPGNIGPPLIAMKARFPDKAKLRAQIWDATAANPESAMVPFGRFKVLTDDEIDKVVEYIWTL